MSRALNVEVLTWHESGHCLQEPAVAWLHQFVFQSQLSQLWNRPPVESKLD